MRVIGFTALHYGKHYLPEALLSVAGHVDEHYIVYSPSGSFGAQAPIPCPETDYDILQSLNRLNAYEIGVKLQRIHWHVGEFQSEAEHRDTILKLAPDADAILVVDADEIWSEQQLQRLFDEGEAAGVRHVRARGIHFWRSFYRAVIDDYAAPIRLIFPQAPAGEYTSGAHFAHMGYAQPERITYYKQLVHGHRSEWRQGWYENKFLPNSQHDVHPTNVNYWNSVGVDPFSYLPLWMTQHPFAKVAVISETEEA